MSKLSKLAEEIKQEIRHPWKESDLRHQERMDSILSTSEVLSVVNQEFDRLHENIQPKSPEQSEDEISQSKKWDAACNEKLATISNNLGQLHGSGTISQEDFDELTSQVSALQRFHQ